ncbi:MAG TPA: restriction endonuclease [Rhodanobacteraceae bacterium]|nr:restriction endonuclease [Rhodanobacteraceae bacterium]
MTGVTKARAGELLRNLLLILAEHPEGMRAADALVALEQRLGMTEFESGDYESGGRRFERLVRFGTVPAVKAGWMTKQKGTWLITDEGRAALASITDNEAFRGEVERLYARWRKAQPSPAEESEVDDAAGTSASITLEQAEEMAWTEIEDFLSEMPPYDFQELVGELLSAMGYHVSWTAPPGKDGGVDVVAFNDPLGTRPPRIKVQVKRNAKSTRIDVVGLRSFLAVLGEDDVGLFVALSGFTRDAELEARQSRRHVTLIDAPKLVELWTGHYSALGDAARRRLPLKPIWFLASED